MSKFVKAALVPAVLSFTVLASTSASAWERNINITGPNGNTISARATEHCYGNTCTSRQRLTGPLGHSFTRRGKTTCVDGDCTGTATYTGPLGRSFTVNRRFRQY